MPDKLIYNYVFYDSIEKYIIEYHYHITRAIWKMGSNDRVDTARSNEDGNNIIEDHKI